MRAVDVGVGHDDDLVVAQILVAIVHAGAAAERLHQVGELLVLRELVLAGAGDVEDLSAQRQHGLAGAVARLLGRAAGRVALDDEDLRALRGGVGAVGELAGQAQLARRALALGLLLLAAADALVGALDHPVEQLVGLVRIAGEPMVDVSFIACSTMRCASAVASRSLVWPWNSGSRMNTESMHAGADHHVVAASPLAARLPWPTRSAWSRRPRVSAARRPASCVPPSWVGIVLQ